MDDPKRPMARFRSMSNKENLQSAEPPAHGGVRRGDDRGLGLRRDARGAGEIAGATPVPADLGTGFAIPPGIDSGAFRRETSFVRNTGWRTVAKTDARGAKATVGEIGGNFSRRTVSIPLPRGSAAGKGLEHGQRGRRAGQGGVA